MNTKLSLFALRQRVYRLFEFGAYPFIALMFTLLLCWQVYSIYIAHEELSKEQDTLSALRIKLEKYRENAKISEQDRLVYGTILKRQIPANSGTFDTFALIESFYEATGIELRPSQSGSIGGGNSTQSNFTVADGSSGIYSGSGVLNKDQLDEILKTYQFHFPKFLTLNSIKVSTSKEGNGLFHDVTFTFQTYSLSSNEKKGTEKATSQAGAQFTIEDKKSFDRYVSEANVDLYYQTQSLSTVDEEYEPAGKLF